KKIGDFLRDALDTRPAGDERLFRAAGRARFRHRCRIAAMVAGEFAAEAMFDEPGRTLRTFDAVTAAAAECERRIAAAIEKEHRLLARRERLRDLGDENGREPA